MKFSRAIVLKVVTFFSMSTFCFTFHLDAQVPVPKGTNPSSLAQQATPVPNGVVVHRNLAYVENGHAAQVLDLFIPEKAQGPLPLIIWVHGGGWQRGSKDGCLPLRSGFTERGYAVASIDYRLSGDAVFPAQIEDCKAAVRWLRLHANEYNLNPDRFGVWGSSAGGHLVALLGTSSKAKQFDVGSHNEVSSRVQAVCDYYGPTDLVSFALTEGYANHGLANSAEGKLIGGAVLEHKDIAEQANPVAYVTRDAPPFLIVHGDKDPTVPHHQSELLYSALVNVGVPVRFITVKGGGHGTGFPGSLLNPIVAEFFDRHLKGMANTANWPVAMTSEVAADTQ